MARITTPSCSRSSTAAASRSEEHTSELQSQLNLVCRLLLEKKNIQCTKHAICSIAIFGPSYEHSKTCRRLPHKRRGFAFRPTNKAARCPPSASNAVETCTNA